MMSHCLSICCSASISLILGYLLFDRSSMPLANLTMHGQLRKSEQEEEQVREENEKEKGRPRSPTPEQGGSQK